MLSVDLDQFAECIQRMKDDADSLAVKMEHVEQCQSVLQSLSGMSGIVDEMQSITGKLECEKDGFLSLAHTLEEITKYYQHCEQQIEEQYEQGTIKYQKLEVNFSNLDKISSYFTELEE